MYYALTLLVVWISIKLYDFLDGRRLIKDLFQDFQLSQTSLEQCDDFCTKNKKQSDIIVCLTSIPARIPYLEHTLKSLLKQSIKPKNIQLHIPYFSEREKEQYTIPKAVSSLKNVEIVRCEDLGPATKLLPALTTHRFDQRLLILDDDMVYPERLVEHLQQISDQYPDIAIASSGWVVPDDLICHFVSLRHNLCQIPPMPFKSTRIKAPKEIDILQGYSGYLVKPSFFDSEKIFDYSQAPQAAYFVDDVWISAHCKVKKYVFPHNRFCFHPLKLKSQLKKSSLAQFNRGDNDPLLRNNTVMIRHLSHHWMNSDKKVIT